MRGSNAEGTYVIPTAQRQTMRFCNQTLTMTIETIFIQVFHHFIPSHVKGVTLWVESLTLSSLRLVSGSYMLPVSVLPRRDEVPPSDANVAAERPGVAQREDG